ncbi:hypothetical protein FOA52_015216 [Chlamydomonas sp. UWO 241]|nr:hypothetical protein FOA52_015216 [Chlamydomonas sp. UWO 241]
MAWTLAMLGYCDDSFMSALLLAAKPSLHGFSPDAATVMATALAMPTAGQRSPEFMSDLLAAIYPRLRDFDLRNVVKMLHAVVSFSDNAVDERSFVLVHEDEGALPQLVDAAGGHPFMRVHRVFMAELLEQATLQLPNFKDAHRVNILEALAIAASRGYLDPVLVHMLVMEACPKVASFSTEHVSRFGNVLLEITSVLHNTRTTRPFELQPDSFPECVLELDARRTELHK